MNPPQKETSPLAGRVLANIVSIVATSVLTMFLMVIAIYVDSYLFVVSSALLQNTLGVNYNMKTCDSAILMCLVCYVTTKVGSRFTPGRYIEHDVRIAKLDKGECIIVLFSAIVIHWVTSKNNAAMSRASSTSEGYNGRDRQGPRSSRGLIAGAVLWPASSTLKGAGLTPLSRVWIREGTPAGNVQGTDGGIMVTTEIKVEAEPVYSIQGATT
ncbi:hypothetical protein E4U42_005873 [Claviceps africana]|uniref:Uncharacterized protein n=1 Tax=Claviceps africana TaxID=83212 RepID=A0A8K0J5Z0_9HYPO|nr:hypothetical protein E4U42_005873 [Claviceps africana]